MEYSNKYGELGTAIDFDSIAAGQTGFAPPRDFVINGVTYRSEKGKVYRKQNGSLIPITDPEELLALDRQYVPPPPMRLPTVAGYANKPNTISGQADTGVVIAVIAGIALLFLMRN